MGPAVLEHTGVKTQDPSQMPPEPAGGEPLLGDRALAEPEPGRARYLRAEPETDPALVPWTAGGEAEHHFLTSMARLRQQVRQVLAVMESLAALRELGPEEALVEMAVFAQSHERTAEDLQRALCDCELAAQRLRETREPSQGLPHPTTSPPASHVDPVGPIAEEEGPITQVDTSLPRVLLVDDEPAVLRAFRRVLSPQYEVLTARDGAQALRTVLAGPVDAIVCDLEMPRLDGSGFFAELRELQPQLLRRVVFCAGGAPSAEARRLLDSGYRLLRKPVSADELSQAIDEARRR